MLQSHCSTPGLVEAAGHRWRFGTRRVKLSPVSCWAANVNIFRGVAHRAGQASAWHQLSLALTGSRCDDIWYLRGYFASFPAFHDEAKSTSACPRSTTGLASVYPYWWFPTTFFPTQDHRSMCHPHKHNQVTNTVHVWIIACPWLQEHGLQLLSVSTERSRKMFRWAVMMKLHLLDHQKSWQIISQLKNLNWKDERGQLRLFNSHSPVILTPHIC